jgi:hypothetical protein
MAGSSSAKTRFALLPGHDDRPNDENRVRQKRNFSFAFNLFLPFQSPPQK